MATNIVRHLVVFVFVGLIAGGVTAAETGTTTNQILLMNDLNESGRTTFVVSAVGDDSIPRLSSTSCDALTEHSQVIAAGTLTFERFVDLPTSPGTALRLFSGTGGIADVLDPDAHAMGSGSPNGPFARVSVDAMSSSGLQDQTSLRLSDGPGLTVVGFEPKRHPLGSVMVLAPSGPKKAGQCWFETALLNDGLAFELAQTTFASDNVTITVQTALDSGAFTTDPLQEFQRRPSRYAWAVGALAAILPVVLSLWFRRLDAALYRTLGATKHQVAAIAAGEPWCVLASAITTGSLLAAGIASSGLKESAFIGVLACSKMLLAVTCVVYITALLTARGNLTEQLKDR